MTFSITYHRIPHWTTALAPLLVAMPAVGYYLCRYEGWWPIFSYLPVYFIQLFALLFSFEAWKPKTIDLLELDRYVRLERRRHLCWKIVSVLALVADLYPTRCFTDDDFMAFFSWILWIVAFLIMVLFSYLSVWGLSSHHPLEEKYKSHLTDLFGIARQYEEEGTLPSDEELAQYYSLVHPSASGGGSLFSSSSSSSSSSSKTNDLLIGSVIGMMLPRGGLRRRW